MTTETTTINRGDVLNAVGAAYRKSLGHDGGRWFYVTVWPDGTITDGMETGPRYPESEYFGRRPHPVTVWSTRANNSLTDEEIEAEMDAVDDDWFDGNVGNLATKLEPTGLTVED